MLLVKFLKWWYLEVIFNIFNIYNYFRDFVYYKIGLKLVLDHYNRLNFPIWITIFYLPVTVLSLILARIISFMLVFLAIFIPPVTITGIIYNLIMIIK